MKLITAIINKQDAPEVCFALTDNGFYFTKLATTGGFLSAKNITLLMGVEDERVEEALEIIRKRCTKRKEIVPTTLHHAPTPMTFPAEVIVGGATVFVTDVEHFEKM